MSLDDSNFKWYVVHTYSNMENRAKLGLLERIRKNKLEHYFKEILVPSEKVESLRSGNKIIQTKKFFPGYIIINMDLNEESWHLIKNTPKITGFIGNSKKPPALTDDEVDRMINIKEISSEKPRTNIEFNIGEEVKVNDGPFMNFTGVVDEINHDKEKIKVNVSIFGRLTPVELEYIQVKKLN